MPFFFIKPRLAKVGNLCDNAVLLFVCLSVCRLKCVHKNAVSQKLSSLELQSLLMTNRKYYMGFSKKPLLDSLDSQ